MTLEFLKYFEFFTGVPDSQLKPLCNYLMANYGIGDRHVITANEGNAVALAAGYHLATGKVPVVYLQNSGIGNIINPVASLMHDKVYGIPCVFFIGWRGEPGVHDEPQHIYQGEVTLRLLEDMGIAAFVISKDTTQAQVLDQLQKWQPLLSAGKQVAFVVKKGALSFDGTVQYSNRHRLLREDIIRHIAVAAGDDCIISTTGKASRELFEIREQQQQGHEKDFLTVGSMGHSTSIALGIAVSRPEKRIWVIDGDGAALMHMGAMAVLGSSGVSNIIHILINNEAHETVGGMPTVAGSVDFVAIAKGCGYTCAVSVDSMEALTAATQQAVSENVLTFIEVKCAIGSREDLGRPTTTAKENKQAFMAYLQE